MSTKEKKIAETDEVKCEPGSKEYAAYMREKVPVKLFKDDAKYKDDVFVSVNGKTFLIKRGHEVMVPRYVKEVLDNSYNQDANTAEMLTEKQAAFEKADKD